MSPNVKACARTKDFYDSRGKYLKTACSFDTPISYAAVQDECSKIGMNLFKVCPQVEADLISYTASIWDNKGALWVNDNINGKCSAVTAFQGVEHRFRMEADINCLNTYYFYCEYSAIPVPVKPKLDKTACAATKDFFDDKSNYLKSACLIARAYNNDATSEVCGRYGMKVFMNTPTTEKALTTYAGELWGSEGSVWIDDVNNEDKCTAVTVGNDGKFMVSSTADCTEKYYIFCEY